LVRRTMAVEPQSSMRVLRGAQIVLRPGIPFMWGLSRVSMGAPSGRGHQAIKLFTNNHECKYIR
jgi:hypothetical protein